MKRITKKTFLLNKSIVVLIFLLLLLSRYGIAQQQTLIDSSTITINTSISGDQQYQITGRWLECPLKVLIVQNITSPIAGLRVDFSVISAPKNATAYGLERKTVLTDNNGYAQTNFQLGSEPGEYIISARIHSKAMAHDEVFFKVYGLKSNWVIMLFMGLVGGLAMFLFGMDQMSDGLKKRAGSKMRSILSRLTKNRFIGVLVGAFVTIMIQSSSATTVMLVSFVRAQLLPFVQTLGVILGADIGTTITVQLVAFKLTDVALLFVGLGFCLKIITEQDKIKSLGDIFMGFGLLFFGMHVMSEAMYPLRNYSLFIKLLATLKNPILGVMIGAIFTALIQSSAAFIGIIIVLAQQNLITLEAGIALLFGANIGTCITAFLASINASRAAKRVALAHTLFKVGGVLVFIWWIPYYAKFISELANNLPRQIAHAHTIFNVMLTMLFFPIIGVMAKLSIRILPDKKIPEPELSYNVKYLDDNLLSTPSLALSLAKKEVLSMGSKVQKVVEAIIFPFINYNMNGTADRVKDLEEEIDFLQEKITVYLTNISRQSVDEERVDEVFQIMYTVTELEQMGDIVSKNLLPLAIKMIDRGYAFSEEGKKEIIDYHTRTMKQVSRALEVFKDVNLEKAEKMEYKYVKYRLMEMNLRRVHFERLRHDVPETVATSEIHLELMDLLKQISSHATNIARNLLTGGRGRKAEDIFIVK